MNDLITKTQELMEKAHAMAVSGEVWAVEPLGHTEYQIRKFVLKDRDYPTPDLKYRQCILEIWTRWVAWRQAKYQYDKLGAQIEIWKAEQDELREETGKSSAQHKKSEAQVGLLDIEISNAEAQRGELLLDMQYRIIRETEVLMDEASKVSPAEGNRMEVESNNWKERAKFDPKVKQTMEETR